MKESRKNPSKPAARSVEAKKTTAAKPRGRAVKATEGKERAAKSPQALIDDFITGLGRQSTLILDSLGISLSELNAAIARKVETGQAIDLVIRKNGLDLVQDSEQPRDHSAEAEAVAGLMDKAQEIEIRVTNDATGQRETLLKLAKESFQKDPKAPLDPQWLDKLLTDNGSVIRHHHVPVSEASEIAELLLYVDVRQSRRLVTRLMLDRMRMEQTFLEAGMHSPVMDLEPLDIACIQELINVLDELEPLLPNDDDDEDDA